jgi:hypothetical protein
MIRLVAIVALTALPAPKPARAEADTLARGDVSIGLYQTVDPFNRYWYHFNGPNDCPPGPCSRFNWNSYKVYHGIIVNDQEQTIPTTIVADTGLRLEYGLVDRLTVSGETKLEYTSPDAPALSLGDSRLGLKWRAIEGPTIFSLSGLVKLPGTYVPTRIGAPGNGQPDIELKGLIGGLASHRKLFYDVGFGYRLRLPFKNAATVTVTPYEYAGEEATGTLNEAAAKSFVISGPADEIFLDFALGFYTSRRTMVYFSGNLVNSFSGYDLSDYFTTAAASTARDGLGRSLYKVEGDPANLLTSLEEDYIRLGVGLLFKAYYNTTAYLYYSYNVLGQNTSAFYVTGSKIPIGAVAIGIEYTFGTRQMPGTSTASRARSASDSALTMRLPHTLLPTSGAP